MSETQQPTPPPAEPEYVPQHVLSSEDDAPPAQPQPEPEPPPPEKTREQELEERLANERRREAQRVGQLTRQRYEQKARADALEARLQQIEQHFAQQQPQQPQPQFTQADFDRAIEQRVAQDAWQARVGEWDGAGKQEFGEKFADACKTVADMASPEQRNMLLQIAMDTEGGQRAVMELAGNPAEAERVLALPPHKMALALTKLGAPPEAPKPPPVSSLPPPIRPPTAGRAATTPDPEKGGMDSFLRWSAQQKWRR